MGPREIAVLAPDVIDKIAAGEVVERPASVVKELLENAIDAGARRIEIETRGGGRELIRVVDDGVGMSAEEATLALKRHATSKLRQVTDLQSIATMGFRGEGLSSVAAVSRLTLHTRRADDDVGWRLAVSGGGSAERTPAARSVGTTVDVAELFYNTPARLKFLKSSAAEAAHITDITGKLACGFPELSLTLRQNGRTVLELPRADSRLERVKAVLGRRGARLLAARCHEPGLCVEGCLAPPDEAMGSARQLHLMVNRRPVQDRPLLQAIVQGYGERLSGRYPVGVVFIDIDPLEVDVNVHPQKLEVRFGDPRTVFRAVRRGVAQAIDDAGWAEAPARSYGMPRPAGGYEEHKLRLQAAARRFWSAQLPTGASEADSRYAAEAAPAPGSFASLRVLGQALDDVLVCEDASGLVLIGVRAARARIALARLTEALDAGEVAAQRLLIPVTLTLDPQQADAAERHASLLSRLGLELEPFGGEAWTVRALPQPLSGADPAQLVIALLEELGRAGQQEGHQRALARAASVAAAGDAPLDSGTQLLLALDRAGLSLERDGIAMELIRVSAHTTSQAPLALCLDARALGKRLTPADDDRASEPDPRDRR